MTAEEQVHLLSQQLEQLKEEKRLLEARYGSVSWRNASDYYYNTSYEKALTSLADSEAKMETMQSELKLAHDQMSTMWEELGRQQVANPLVSSSYIFIISWSKRLKRIQ